MALVCRQGFADVPELAKGAPIGKDAFTFLGAANFSAEGQVRAVAVSGFIRIEMETTGTSRLEDAMKIAGIIAFTSSDFIL